MKSKGWDRVAPFYDKFMKEDMNIYEVMYELIRKQAKDKYVLEVGTGTGLIAKNIVSVTKKVIATDYSKKMIEVAKKSKYPKNLEFLVADGSNLKYEDDEFDLAIVSNVLHVVPNAGEIVEEIRRVVKNKGIIIAPTFVHSENTKLMRFKTRVMGIVTGFKVENEWSLKTYEQYLEKNGLKVAYIKRLQSVFHLAYVECINIK